MAPPSVSAESKKQRERNRGRKRRQQLRQQSQAQQLQEADSHETVRLVSQVHHAEADVTNHHLHEHSCRGHPVTSAASIQHLPPETSDFRDSSISYNTSLQVPPPTAALSAAPVTHSPTDTRRTSSAFRTDADLTSAGELLMQGSFEAVAAAISGPSDTDEQMQATAGRPRRDLALSERELTRLRVRAYRARQHLSRIPQTAQPQDDGLLSNCIDSENQCSARGISCPPQNDATSPVPFHQGDDAQQAASDWRRTNSSSPASPMTSDFGFAPFDTTSDHFRIADSHSVSPDRSSRESPTSPIGLADRVHMDLPYLNRFIEALRAQEMRCGLDFLESQTTIYDRIFQTFFAVECHCLSSHEIHDHTRAHTLQERARFLQNSLPPLTTIFDERFAHKATKYLHQWKEFLSDEPDEPLSFHKTEATLEHGPVHIERRWDVDSIWFGPKSLQAVHKPGIFRLSFMPPFKRNLSTDQVIRPHGLDLANRTAVLDSSGNELPGAAEALGKENDVTIAKIHWLGDRENGKTYGSMVICVTKGNDAKLLDIFYLGQ
ncbi:hypothetical protein AUP68_10433 [Ilyonectria robusta]